MSMTVNINQQTARVVMPVTITAKKVVDEAISGFNKTDDSEKSPIKRDESGKSEKADNASNGAAGGVSPAVANLQKRIKELEKQLQEQEQQLQQQQQLQKASSVKYSSDTEKTTAVMAAQNQISMTSAALSQASSQLCAELSKNPIRTTA